jgi:hypothetical protein
VDIFELNTTSNARGHSKKMKIKTSRLNVRKYTFVVRIVEIWNSLPESVIQAKTVKQFEIGLDMYVVQVFPVYLGYVEITPYPDCVFVIT